jgi:hypothetical protein
MILIGCTFPREQVRALAMSGDPVFVTHRRPGPGKVGCR